jgi:two-component system, OmpR family, sensor histidine kinase MtrB
LDTGWNHAKPWSTRPAGSFRWRLTVAFILASGVSAGVFALVSILLLHQDREENFIERARDRVDVALSSRDHFVPTSAMWKRFYGLANRLKRTTGADAVLVRSGETLISSPSIAADNMPSHATEGVQADFTSVIEVSGKSYLIVSRKLPESDTHLYFLFSRGVLSAGLSRLIWTMLTSWVFVVVLSAFVGTLLARRTLQPVARGSHAAQSLAEGLLDTRLPVESEDEFGAWAVSFNRMAAALEEKIKALSEARDRERRFASDVSHELRTPLAAVVSAASMVKEHLDRLPHEARWPAERLLAQVTRFRSLVEELLEMARLDSDHERLALETVAIRDAIGAVIAPLSLNVEVHVAVEAGDVIVITDRRRLERILGNLIENACAHAHSDVQVKVSHDTDNTLIDVIDDGPGVGAEHLPHIFDRFYKADAARTGGSGLGLSIARENARLLGGDIEIDSSPNIGARFTVRLPSRLLEQRKTHIDLTTT